MERVFFVEKQGELVPCPQPVKGRFKGLYSKVGNKLARLCGNHSPIPRDQYPGMFQGRKKTIYTNAVASLLDRPYEVRDSFLKTFVKCEKINFSKKPDPAPRVIQPRDPRYNVELGRYLKPAEHRVYHAIDMLWGGPTVMKGYTVERTGELLREKWDSFLEPAAIGFDMSRFDQHVSVDALKYEHRIYLNMFNNDGHLASLLSHQIESSGVAYATDGRLYYKVKGCRMSGDVNTSLGNIILACSITKAICKELGVRAKLVNNGDDCVLICERSDVSRVEVNLAQKWLQFGFTCICEPVQTVFEKIEFCQMNPILVEGRYKMVRNPRTTLSKDSVSTTPFEHPKDAMEWAYSVGLGGLSLASGIPIVQEYYQCMLRNGIKSSKDKLTHFWGEYWAGFLRKHHGKYLEVSEETRHSFHLAFSISPDQQVALEEYYKNLHLLWEFAPASNDLAIIEWTLQNPIVI